MSAYEEAVQRFRTEYVLDAVVEMNGSYGKAAQMIGVHRNLVSRILNEAGYDVLIVRALVRKRIAMAKPDREEA
jgi:predicted DNA-binding protein (UPF0251 family)